MYSPLFHGVPFNALIRVQGIVQLVCAEEKSVVVSSGDAGTAMFIITGGAIKLENVVSSSASDDLEMLYAGDSFGEEIITGVAESYSYNAMSLVATSMYMIEEKDFKEAFEYLPDCLEQMQHNVINSSRFAVLFPDLVQKAKLKMEK